MCDYYECQAVILVHIVSVQSFQLSESFEAGLDDISKAVYIALFLIFIDTKFTICVSIQRPYNHRFGFKLSGAYFNQDNHL